MRWGALTRAAKTATSTRNTERETIPATLSRGETVGVGTVVSGAHRKPTRTGDLAAAESDPARHTSNLRPIAGSTSVRARIGHELK